jgi:hypothetical protein
MNRIRGSVTESQIKSAIACVLKEKQLNGDIHREAVLRGLLVCLHVDVPGLWEKAVWR